MSSTQEIYSRGVSTRHLRKMPDPDPKTLELPPIELAPQRRSLGTILFQLRKGRSYDVASATQVKVSPRRSEKVYALSNGERIIVTARPTAQRPRDVDGVLRMHENGSTSWLSHRILEESDEAIRTEGLPKTKNRVAESWEDSFRFRTEVTDNESGTMKPGLRPPQVGALHAIGSHWSLRNTPATIVMPTGTGKTETMLAALVAYRCGTVLVVVPSKALREQTVRKFVELGLLRHLDTLPDEAQNPIVGTLTKRPKTSADLEILNECNVIVATMSALGQGTAVNLAPEIANRVDTLIVDEAHHVAARTWGAFRDAFQSRKVLQFTATPFRRDGKLVDGEVIFNYPLRDAQRDGYFTPITFAPIYELDPETADRTLADAAVEQLRADLANEQDHLLMARCDKIERAVAVHSLYDEIASDLKPILVHSDGIPVPGLLDQVNQRESRIIVCVDMLGEGFDLPQLKVAALHDTHKSLAVLLQFAGRFTRTAASKIGDATVLANLATQEATDALERLYSEDADWNLLLSEFSSQAVKEHSALIEFLSSSQEITDEGIPAQSSIANSLLRPKFSTVVFEAPEFKPKRFFKAIGSNTNVASVWLHKSQHTLYFVTVDESSVPWTRSKELRDRQWNIFVLHYDPARKLLFVHSSDKSSTHDKLAKAVSGSDASSVRGDVVFRALGHIGRLVFHNIGVRKHGRRNLRYALYTGGDVAEALSIAEKAGSVKSNLFGAGWEAGRPVTIGCSYKGRIWTREQGPIPQMVTWCESVGAKLQDDTIDTTKIIDNVLIPEEIEAVPGIDVLSVDWPVEILRQSEERVALKTDESETGLAVVGIENVPESTGTLRFRVFDDGALSATYELRVGGSRGFEVQQVSGNVLEIQFGRVAKPLVDYLNDYPPLFRFMDLSELDGNLLIKPKDVRELIFPEDQVEVWDWTDTNITVESIWKNGERRDSSIQEQTAQVYASNDFEVVFDDDDAGEAADLVCISETADFVRLALVHCKYSAGATPGERVKDVVEVSSQAVRSAKWKWQFKSLCRHLLIREKDRPRPGAASRFLTGDRQALTRLAKVGRFKPIAVEIVVVQPGLSKENMTDEQKLVLASAHSFLKETVDVDLDVICSA